MATGALAAWLEALPFAPTWFWLPVVMLVASGVLIHFDHLGAQIAARATWLAWALPGALVALDGSSFIARSAGLSSLALAVAAAAMGLRGLDARTHAGSFAPKALKRTFLAIIGSSVVSFQWALVLAALTLPFGLPPSAALPVALGATTLVALAAMGLYRLKVWSLLGLVGADAALIPASCLATGAATIVLLPIAAIAAVRLALIAAVVMRIQMRPRALTSR